MGLFTSPAAPAIQVGPVGPPSVEQVFNGASASTAYATSIFAEAVAELEAANDAFDDVVLRTTSEIDRLVNLRQDAADQRTANEATIQRLQALIG